MRTSMPPDEVERIQAAGMPPPRPAAGVPADEPKDFASTVSFDQLGISLPIADAAPPQASPAAFTSAEPSVSIAGAASPQIASPPAGAPMIIPGTGPMAAPPPSRGAWLWIVLILLLAAAAGATFFLLKMR